ncbi:hypothetical protein ABE494_06835 [Stenotrophomonas lactitubi]|uniref:hypothetical protein n=1 Tax=Stenotrophomonas TaxID=40323 RepID=UPI0011B264A7|nr:hypothetical protein [Stenotrophomonas sp. HMWF023]
MRHVFPTAEGRPEGNPVISPAPAVVPASFAGGSAKISRLCNMGLAVLLLLTAFTATAQDAAESSGTASPLRALYRQAGWVEVAHGTGRNEHLRGTMTQYRNRDIVMSAGAAPGRPFHMVLCGIRVVNWDVQDDLDSGVPTQDYSRRYTRMFEYAALLSLSAETAMTIRADGQRHQTTWDMQWATDAERYRASTQRTPQGNLKLVFVKTGANKRGTPAGSKKGGREMPELEVALRGPQPAPIGAWWEIIIGTSPREPALSAVVSLLDWAVLDDVEASTVGDLRRASDECPA